MFKDILVAFQFLTRIPLPQISYDQSRFGRSMRYYPLVGLFIGEILVLTHVFLEKYLPLRIESLFLIAIPILVTGAFHLDGFTDTVDGFLSSKKKEEMLAIMKDSRIGALGAVALIVLLLGKYELLYAIVPAKKSPALLLMPVIGRWSMVVSMYALPYARKEGGLGKPFCASLTRFDLLIATSMTLLLAAVVLKQQAVLFILFCIMLIGILLLYSRWKIGGITGDVCGFIAEIAEVFVLFLFVTVI